MVINTILIIEKLIDIMTENYNRNMKNGANISKNIYPGGRIPPHSIDAEINVLGSMMLDRIAVTKAQELLQPEAFYNESHQLIFKAAIDIAEKGSTPNLMVVAEELHKTGLLEKAGGSLYLSDISSKVPTAANIDYFAHIVQEKYLKRLMITTASEIIESAYDDTSDALEEVDTAENKIFTIAEKRIHKSYMPISKLAHDAIEAIGKARERKKGVTTGVPTGYNEIDDKLGGFQNSDLIIIAGRPSMGKTAFALSVARNTAKEYNRPIAFFSIEMAAVQLVVRLISAEAKINQQKIRNGQITQPEMDKIVKSMGMLAKAPLIIDDTPSLSVMELRAKARRLMKEHNIQMILVDYLQIMSPPKAESREREISIISRTLKQIAKELNIPVVALAQLNRTVESRSDKRPMLSDLRESGSIEQDADVVMFVNRPEYYGIMTYDDKTPTENTAEIIIGKQRNGPTGVVRLAYLKDFARFENLTLQYEEPPGLRSNDDDQGPDF